MNNTLLIIDVIMLFVILPFGLYLLGRIFIPILAEKDTFFSSPKLGRIKARRRGGRIVGFYGNLLRKGKFVNKETGRIETGEQNSKSFFWIIFGAYFIGLDEVYNYIIAVEANEDDKGQLHYIEKEASSIFLEGSYSLSATFITKDGVRLKVKLLLKLSTVDVTKALSLPISWTIPVFGAVLGASRDFFGARNIKTLISTQNEGGRGIIEINGSEYIQKILALNIPQTGNVSLEEMCGQNIDAINIVDIDFADEETKKAFSAPFIAEQLAQGQVKEAEAFANALAIRSNAERLAANNVAAAITAKGNAEADVYGKKCENLGGDAKAAAQVITAEKQSEMENLTTLVNGGGSTVTIPINNKKEGK
jgi:regulator of protease activity HflC (stomatin/prohibitin superfamily)